MIDGRFSAGVEDDSVGGAVCVVVDIGGATLHVDCGGVFQDYSGVRAVDEGAVGDGDGRCVAGVNAIESAGDGGGGDCGGSCRAGRRDSIGW